MADLLDSMRDYLVAQSAVRIPRNSTPAGKPPLWLEPQDGAFAPGDKSGTEDGTLVLSAFGTGGIPARPYESMTRHDVVDVWFRATHAQDVRPVEKVLRGLLTDKRAWTMGDLTVIESLEWRPLQRLGSDPQGFTFIAAYVFETYADA